LYARSTWPPLADDELAGRPPRAPTRQRTHRQLGGLLLLTLAGWATMGAEAANGAAAEIHKLASPHFQLVTDLPDTEAQQALRQMERVLGLVERYWQRPLPGQIHCYLVEDLEHWSAEQFPTPTAPQVLRQARGGTTLPTSLGPGRDKAAAIIYAMDEAGVVEHEVVHAYCFQAFGYGGPAWYREGMAELFSQQVASSLSGPCRAETVRRLRGTSSPTIQGVTRPERFHRLQNQLLLPGENTVEGDASSDEPHWPQPRQDRFAETRNAYAESWALCYLLYQNRNYRERFQSLGVHLLNGAPLTLEDAFLGRTREINFELAQFTENLNVGYRSDLCDWDWNGQARELEVGRSTTIRLHACRGFQSTRLRLSPGQQLDISTQGTWQVGKDDQATDADGQADGRGRLEGATLEEFALAGPIELGKQVRLNAERSGDLYLRCRDDWGELADNRGTIVVRMTREH
jgi:hypothetical protein